MDLALNHDLLDFQHILNDLQYNLYEFKHLKVTKDTDLEFIRLDTQAKTTELYEKLEELENIIAAKLDCVSGDTYKNTEYQFALLKERFFDVRVDFRELLLSSKSWTVQDEEEQIDELTNEPILDDHNLKKLTKEEQLLDKNSALTNKLQSVNQLLQSSLLASEMNISDLAHSTNSLTNLSNKYSYFTDVLVRSNKLVRTINESSSKERKQIYSSLYIFCTVCIWILYKRIFRKPIRLFIWLLYKTLTAIFWGASSFKAKDPIVELTASMRDTMMAVTATFSEPNRSTEFETATSTIRSMLKDEL